MNVEDDEAGRLAAFRARFGRSYDANTPVEDASKDPVAAKAEAAAKAQEQAEQEEEDNLLDLISEFGQNEAPPPPEKKNPYGKNPSGKK
jgi:hypothetical protein